LEQEARPVILYLAGDLDTYQKCASLRTCRASVGRERGPYWVSFHFPLAKEGDGLFGGGAPVWALCGSLCDRFGEQTHVHWANLRKRLRQAWVVGCTIENPFERGFKDSSCVLGVVVVLLY